MSVPPFGICSETGLPERPPVAHPDGTIRYRICKRCNRSKSLKSFGRVVREVDTPFGEKGIYRRRVCTACHDGRKADRRERIERQKVCKQMGKAAAEIRRTTNLEVIRGIVERIACDVGGDLERFCEVWVSLIHDPKTSNRLKLTSLQTIVYLFTVMESARVAEEKPFEQINSIEYIEFLHNRKQLAAMVRAALGEGLLTWDDIDPAPMAEGEIP